MKSLICFLLLLAITAGLGSLAVFVSIIIVFLFFIGFHAGSRKIRSWIIERKDYDAALRATAGAGEAGRGIDVLRTIANKAAAKKRKEK